MILPVSSSSSKRRSVVVLVGAAAAVVNIAAGRVSLVNAQQSSCISDCATKYGGSTGKVLADSCKDLCETRPELFDIEYPYLFGPLPMKPEPNLTDIDATEILAAFPTGGELYARVNADRTKIQFRLNMIDNPEPYYPYFAMHLHEGNLNATEIGGHVIVHIAGKGDLVGCLAVSRKVFRPKNRGTVCSKDCTPGNHDKTNCLNPNNFLVAKRCRVCNVVLAAAYHCEGGCQGDYRISGNRTGTSVAPSRVCDLNNPNKPSNPLQNEWIQGLHSHEFSGNPDDGDDYSPYSIGIPENYKLWCGEELPFLVDTVLKEGAASYVALHVNFNATGLPALLYGDIFTAVTTREGGPQKCSLYGNTNLPCTEGFADIITPISEPLE